MYDTNMEFSMLSPPKDFFRLLICYEACFSILEIIEKICVAISLRSNYKVIGRVSLSICLSLCQPDCQSVLHRVCKFVLLSVCLSICHSLMLDSSIMNC